MSILDRILEDCFIGDLKRIRDQNDLILATLNQLTERISNMGIAITNEVRIFAQQIDAATTMIADELEALRTKLAAEDDPEAIRAILQPAIDRLRGIATNPADPVPGVIGDVTDGPKGPPPNTESEETEKTRKRG